MCKLNTFSDPPLRAIVTVRRGKHKGTPIKLSKTQIDRLGERLRAGTITESDLRLLDDYRKSLGGAYESVVQAIRVNLEIQPTGRPAKSTTAIMQKLQREHIRLTQVQDIAGCRVIVDDILQQESVAARLQKRFPSSGIIDRRKAPSHGYRAIHIVVSQSDKLIEIQVRTELQHLWAELSEKLSDVVDPAIKYGGGDSKIRGYLSESAELVAKTEQIELIEAASSGKPPFSDIRTRTSLVDFVGAQPPPISDLKAEIRDSFSRLIAVVEKMKGREDDFFD